MKGQTKKAAYFENNLPDSWVSEMQQILGPRKLHNINAEQRVVDHIKRCRAMANGFQPRSMFFLLDNIQVKYIFVSKSASTLLGYSTDEIVNNGFHWLFTLFTEEEMEYKRTVMADLFEFLRSMTAEQILNCTVRYDLVVERKDGKKIHLLEEMMYPEVNEQGEPLTTSCFLHDIGGFAGEPGKRKCEVFLRNADGYEEVAYAKTYQINNRNSSPLSLRETQILEQFSNGLTTTQVAHKLYISENTVKTHRKNILFKLQVMNTAEAIKLSISNNWLS